MQVQIINNQFDSDMKSIDFNENTFIKIKESVEKPIIVADKTKIPQWKFCTVKGKKRCTDNMDSTNVLILDFDDANYTYQEFEHQFQEYQYILHTSYSYNGQNSKFRVLMFLDKEYEISKMFYKSTNVTFSPYNYLINFFQHVDPASFVKAQFFKVPAKSGETAPYYFNIHSGKLLDLYSIPGYSVAYLGCESHDKQQKFERNTKYAIMKTQFKGDMTKAVEYVKRKMEEAPEGLRHNSIFGLAAWFSKVGGDYQTFARIRPSWADKTFDKQIQRLEKEWNKIGTK